MDALSENMTAQSIDDRPSEIVIYLGNGRSSSIGELVHDALKYREMQPLTPEQRDATISRQLDTIRDQADKIERVENERDENSKNLSLAFADQAALRRVLRELREQQAVAREESSDVIRKCNEQLSAMAAAAKLRDQQVETLARLWSAAFEHRGSPLGPTLTRQLYRVMADHGVDVSNLPDPHNIDTAGRA